MELLKEDGCIGEKAFHGEKECFFQPFYNVEKRGSGERKPCSV